MRKAVLFLAALIILAGVSIMLLSLLSEEKEAKGGLKVAASFYPLAHFAEKAGGERIDVFMVTPAGVESHDFEPTPRDIKRIREASLFLYNGAGLDPWAERIEPTLRESGVRTLGMASKFTLLNAEKEDGHDEDGHNHGEEAFDPHIWLDPLMAAEQTSLIGEALEAADPTNAASYRALSREYSDKLKALHEEFSAGLSKCERRDLVVAHDAFGYLARRYGVNIIAVTGVFSGEDPSPRRIAEITKIVRERSIRYIFFEPLTSPKIAETIARETGAKVLEINPLEGLTKDEVASGKDYISVMRMNLANIRKALQCI
ncbi:MAG: zinc ABC transporter substrate-binding protein [Deltaproteobacteria bacterium]|nr:zinc ABC transporter substrate-binding protein [Deltaproteobacteria bacterium]